jgi:hypothetical protein
VASPVSEEAMLKTTFAKGSLLSVILRLSVAPDSVTVVEVFVSVIVNPSDSPASVLVTVTV